MVLPGFRHRWIRGNMPIVLANDQGQETEEVIVGNTAAHVTLLSAVQSIVLNGLLVILLAVLIIGAIKLRRQIQRDRQQAEKQN